MNKLYDVECNNLIERFKQVRLFLETDETVEFTTYIQKMDDDGYLYKLYITISGNQEFYRIKSDDGLYESKPLMWLFEEEDIKNIADEIFKAFNGSVFHTIKNFTIPLIDTLVGIESCMNSTDDKEIKQCLLEYGKLVYSKIWDFPEKDHVRVEFESLCELSAEGYGKKFLKIEDVWGIPSVLRKIGCIEANR